ATLALQSVLFDRWVALISLLWILLIAIARLATLNPDNVPIATLLEIVVGLLILSYGSALLVTMDGKSHFAKWLPPNVVETFRTIRRLFAARQGVVLLLPLSILIHVIWLFVFYLIGVSIGAPLSIADAYTIGPIILFAHLLPISIAGWGVREAT